jgi:hypothetical protein
LPQFITLSGEISNIFPAYSIEFKHVVTFSGATIYADGVPFDDWWIETLYLVGSSDGFAGFNVAHSDSLMLPLLTQTEDGKDKRWRLYEQLKLDARKKVGGWHRATIDVQYLIELFRLCINRRKSFRLPDVLDINDFG